MSVYSTPNIEIERPKIHLLRTCEAGPLSQPYLGNKTRLGGLGILVLGSTTSRC